MSSLPFPFTTIKDYEASMRAPIGREFVPETAHRKLTMSSIVTKAGVVIEPLMTLPWLTDLSPLSYRAERDDRFVASINVDSSSTLFKVSFA